MHFAKLFIYIPDFRNWRCIPGLIIAISLSWMNYFGPLVQPVQGRDLDTGESGYYNQYRAGMQQSWYPELKAFTQQVADGRSQAIAGVFVPGVLAYKVVAQPAGQPGFVSLKDGVLTQFGMAWRYHTIGLLAHNDHAGASFFSLREGMLVALVYRDGRVAYYRIGEVQHMRALSPNSPTSSFLDLDHPGKKLTVLEVFKRIYAPGQRLVFQTCIEAEGNLSWGRLFVTAYPADDASLTQFPVQPPG